LNFGFAKVGELFSGRRHLYFIVFYCFISCYNTDSTCTILKNFFNSSEDGISMTNTTVWPQIVRDVSDRPNWISTSIWQLSFYLYDIAISMYCSSLLFWILFYWVHMLTVQNNRSCIQNAFNDLFYVIQITANRNISNVQLASA
jgi:hypothetical protein